MYVYLVQEKDIRIIFGYFYEDKATCTLCQVHFIPCIHSEASRWTENTFGPVKSGLIREVSSLQEWNSCMCMTIGCLNVEVTTFREFTFWGFHCI